MTALDSYHDLTEQGFNFWLEEGALKYRAPKGKMTTEVLTWLKTHKQELISLLATNDHYPKSAVANVSPQIKEVNATFGVRYAHMVKCQHCEHLTLTGYCMVKPQVKRLPEAMHDCPSFDALKTERISISIQAKTYTSSELLAECEESLFYHLLDCSLCHIERGEYCLQGKERGQVYDDVLLQLDDAQTKRESLALRIDQALISGRRVFSFDHDKVPPPPNSALQTRKYGIGDSERLFVNHLMACDKYKPVSRTYCVDGLKLKADADADSV